MDAESLRHHILSLPHVAETVQWGGALVFWAAEKSIGGRIFAVMRLETESDRRNQPVLSFLAGPELFAELTELDGIIPAPYFARAHWVSITHWNVLARTDLELLLTNARLLAFAKLPAHTRAFLSLPPTQRRKLAASKSEKTKFPRKIPVKKKFVSKKTPDLPAHL